MTLCPDCNVFLMNVEEIPLIGIGEVECQNGHINYYDFDNNCFTEKPKEYE